MPRFHGWFFTSLFLGLAVLLVYRPSLVSLPGGEMAEGLPSSIYDLTVKVFSPVLVLDLLIFRDPLWIFSFIKDRNRSWSSTGPPVNY